MRVPLETFITVRVHLRIKDLLDELKIQGSRDQIRRSKKLLQSEINILIAELQNATRPVRKAVHKRAANSRHADAEKAV